MQRFGAANADLATQNLFSNGLLASLFHEDPRYFRKGQGSPVFPLVWYSMTRLVVTRRDSGRPSVQFLWRIGDGDGDCAIERLLPVAKR